MRVFLGAKRKPVPSKKPTHREALTPEVREDQINKKRALKEPTSTF